MEPQGGTHDRGFHGGGMAGGFRGGGDFRGGEDHFTNYAHTQDPHAAWDRSDDTVDVNRTVSYGGGGYYGGYGDHPWAAGRQVWRREPQGHGNVDPSGVAN